MNRVLQILHVFILAALGALIVLGCRVMYDVHERVKHFDQTITDANRAIVIMGGAATDLQKTLALERTAATDQLRMASETLTRLNGVVNDLGKTADQATDTIALLGNAVQHQDAQLTQLEDQAKTNLADLDASEKQITPAIDNFNTASAQLAFQLPAILRSTNLAAASTAATAENVNMTTHDIQQFVHRETTPVRGTWNVIKQFLSQFAGPAAQVATATRK